MRLTAAFALVIMLAGVVPRIWAQAPPPYELRTSVADPRLARNRGDATQQFGLSKLRGAYVCPICGYSCNASGVCPNPFNVPAAVHPNNTALVPASLAERVLAVAKPYPSGMNPPPCDVAYRDTDNPSGGETWNDPNQRRVIIGRPFHPQRNGAAPAEGNQVFAEWAWPGRPDRVRVHFLTIPPGVKEPQAYYDNWRSVSLNDAPPAGDPDGQGPIQQWECLIELNPHRAADGDTYTIRSYMCLWRQQSGAWWIYMSHWRVQVYSNLYGLEFDSGHNWQWTWGANNGMPWDPWEYPVSAPPGPFYRIVTASGALRITLPRRWKDNNVDPMNYINACWEVKFDVHNTAKMTPQPPAAPAIVTAPPPTDYWLEGPAFEWTAYNGAYFTFDANGRVRNTDAVVGGSSPGGHGVPYSIKPGEVGPGRVEVHWKLPSPSGLADVVPWNWLSVDVGTAPNIFRTYYVADRTAAGNPPYGEWWYSDDDGDPTTNNAPTNADLAQAIPVPRYSREYEAIESRFLSVPHQVPKSDPGKTDRHGQPVEPSPATPDGYARILVGRDLGAQRDDLALPGTTTPRRFFRILHCLNQGDVYYRCPLSGAVFLTPIDAGLGYPEDTGDGISPYYGDHFLNPPPPAGTGPYRAPGNRVPLQREQVGGVRLLHQILQSLTVPEVAYSGGSPVNPWSSTFPTLRPHIPDEAVTVGPQGRYLPPGSNSPQYQGGQFWVTVDIPKYQTASEPGEAPGNSSNHERNWGYRGMAVAYVPQGSVPSPDFDHNGKWDAYYVCPDCGTPYNGPIPAVVGPGNVFACQNPTCPGHEWCPVCGSVYPTGTGICPADSAPLNVVDPPTANNFGFKHIAAEPYDPYDLQVSVAKRTELAFGHVSPDMARVAPGTDLATPDDTVAAYGGLPVGRRPDPANVSLYGQMVVRNEGNTVPNVVGVSPLPPPLGTGIESAWYRLFRPEGSQVGRNYGWAAVRNPIAQPLHHTYYDDTRMGMLRLVPTPTDPWVLVNPAPGENCGTAAGVIVQTGTPGGDVVGTGQILGRYSGTLLYFMDQNGDGVLQFRQGGVDTDSRQAVFNPEQDEPLEPVVATRSRLRVSEARFPFNDYFARDLAPTPRFDYDDNGEPIRLQVFWMTDRRSARRVGDLAPPTRRPADAPPTDAPLNLVYATANAVGADENREYRWQGPHPIAETGATEQLAQNGPADVYADGVGSAANLFALWHATTRMGGKLKSELRLDTSTGATGTWDGSGPAEFLWTGQDRAEGVRGFFDADHANAGANPAHWAFWHTGQRGHEKIHYRVTFQNGTYQTGVLPVDNSISPENPATTATTLHDVDGIGPEVPVPVTLQRFPHGPFVAVKDVSPMLYLPPLIYDTSGGGSATQPQIRVFFAGYARHLRNFDIYEVRFNRADFLTGANNKGKLEFARVPWRDDQGSTEGMPVTNPTAVANGDFGNGPGEEFTADPMRREFHSLHLDWSTSTNFVNGGGTGDARFVLGVKLRGVTPDVHYYDVSWGPANPARGERYDPKQGVFKVIPRFTPLDAQFMPLPSALVGPVGAVGADELIEPSTRVPNLPLGEQRPVQLEVDPTLGRIRFSAPLFNTRNPADMGCVFNTVIIPELRDVFICGTYSPFIKRLTTSPADDDMPTAIMQSGPWNGNQEAPEVQSRPWPLNANNQCLLLFWRRTFGAGQAPFYGRTCTMIKTWSWIVQVNHPPIRGPKSSVVVSIAGMAPPLQGPGMPTEIPGPLPPFPQLQARNEYDVDLTNGVIAIWPGVYRWATSPNGNQHVRAPVGPGTAIQVQYTDYTGTTRSETHHVGGWSQETVVPIDSVLSEGALRVAEETYTVPWSPNAAPGDPRLVARRYWLFWTSPRPVYDLRSRSDNGSEVRQTSDIYYCTLAPEFPTLIRERRASSYAADDFVP